MLVCRDRGLRFRHEGDRGRKATKRGTMTIAHVDAIESEIRLLREKLRAAEGERDNYHRLRDMWQDATQKARFKLTNATTGARRMKAQRDEARATIKRLRGRERLRNTCAACSALLVPSAVVPHCQDTCLPTEEQEEVYLDTLDETKKGDDDAGR